MNLFYSVYPKDIIIHNIFMLLTLSSGFYEWNILEIGLPLQYIDDENMQWDELPGIEHKPFGI